MRIKRQYVAEKPLVNVIPIVDMMLILIIFLLASTQFAQEERDIQVNLPQVPTGETISDSARAMVVVNVRRDGGYVVAGNPITPDELRAMLVKAVAANPSQQVLVRGDKQALHGYVAEAVRLCNAAGIQRANIGYELPR
jgi:biopolymer transport protein ExbD